MRLLTKNQLTKLAIRYESSLEIEKLLEMSRLLDDGLEKLK